jgi:UDP-N-acetyl-2-amino-2-deoxyglucuronate dehydrogenase
LKLKSGAWRTDAVEIPGGCLMQIGIHHIDNLLYLLGPATDVTAYFNRLEVEPEIEDVIALLMRFESGAIGYVATDYISPRRFEVTLHSTKANAYFNIDNDGLRIQREGETKPSPVEFGRSDHLLAELEEFAESALDGKTPEVGGEEALLPLAVVLAAQRSSKEGRSVALSEF